MKVRTGLVIAGAAAALAIGAYFLPLGAWSGAVTEWVRDAGAAGVLVFALLYIAAALLLVPGSALTLGAGFAYGPLWGAVLVSPVSVAAAAGAFGLARSALRRRMERRIQGNPRFQAIDEAVAHGGFRIVLLLRLSPVFPFTLLNYALGLTRVRWCDYLLASFIGMLPGTVLYVYLGSLAETAADLSAGAAPSGGAAQQALYWSGLAAAVVVTVLITRTARRALRERVADPAGAASELETAAHSILERGAPSLDHDARAPAIAPRTCAGTCVAPVKSS